MTQVLKYLSSLKTFLNTDTPGEWPTTVNGIPLVATTTATGVVLGRATTGTPTRVAATGADQLLLAANTSRQGATFYNDSSVICYLLAGTGTASATVFTVIVQGAGYYEVPFGYTGIVRGFYAAASGNMNVTEYT